MDLSDVRSFKVGALPVVLRSTQAFGEIVAFEMVARGTVTIPSKAGQLELLLDTMAHGTPSYSKEDIDRIFIESGAAFGIDPRSDYIEVSLKCLKKYLPKLLPVISEILTAPLLTSEEIEISRSQMLSHLKSEVDHPDHVIQLNLSKAFLHGHPYFLRPSGYLDTVPGITRDEIAALVPKLFNSGNLQFTIIGNLSEQEATELVQKHFSKLPAGQPGAMVTKKFENPVGKVIFEKKESPTTYFLAKFKAPSLMDDDYPALVLATEILHHRLFEEVRTKRGLTYSVSCSLGNAAVNTGYIYTTSTQLAEATKVIFDEVKKIQTELIPEETLELQIRKFTSSWHLGREQAASQASILSLYEIIGGTWKNANSFIGRLNAVRPELVRKVAQNYLKGFTYSIVGPKDPKLHLPTK